MERITSTAHLKINASSRVKFVMQRKNAKVERMNLLIVISMNVWITMAIVDTIVSMIRLATTVAVGWVRE